MYYMPYTILSVRYLAWLKIVFSFFLVGDNLLAVSVFSKFMPTLILTRPYVTKTYYVQKATRPALKAATNGAYQSSHPVIIDTDLADTQDNVSFMHQSTDGKGLNTNPSS